MLNKKFTLAKQIKKEIGNRILFCSAALFLIIFGLTFYDISTEIDQLPARINPQLKPLEDFAMNQIMIDNAQTIQLKLSDFNQSNKALNVKWFPKGTPQFNKISWQFPFSWMYNYPMNAVAGFQLGYFQVQGSFLNDPMLVNELLIRLGLLIIFAFAIFGLLYPLARKIPDKLFIAPINRFIDLASQNNTNTVQSHILPSELTELETKITALLQNAKDYERSQAAIKLGLLAAQVAHDIRSPLSALNVMVKANYHIPEEQRITIRNVSQRINDIANNLLAQYKKTDDNQSRLIQKNELTNELISVLIDRIVSEKRAQYQDKYVKLILTIDETAHGLFATISASKLKSILSNLIDNAAEAISDEGIINVILTRTESQLSIKVNDNGCGMSPEVQTAVLQEGISIGKKGGTGIGLASSKQLIESWGGSFKIESNVGKGTTIILSLLQSEATSWFLSELFLTPNQTIVILDDDQSIHDIWISRFSNELRAEDKITSLHYCQAEQLFESYATIPEQAQFLVDYELHTNNMNGLDIIKMLNIVSRATLVTSHDDDLDLRAECQALGIKILPKTFAVHVPLIVLPQCPDMVFIDDNKMVTESWRFMSKFYNKSVLTFNTINDARKVISSLSKETKIYIDAELSENERGENFAKELYELGYKELYLATGHEKEKFTHCYWLKDIVDKEPPFINI